MRFFEKESKERKTTREGTNNLLKISEKMGKSALHKAVKDGEVNVVKDLLAKGADKDEKNDKGQTPLIMAVSC